VLSKASFFYYSLLLLLLDLFVLIVTRIGNLTMLYVIIL